MRVVTVVALLPAVVLVAASEASSDTIGDDGFPVLHTIEVA